MAVVEFLISDFEKLCGLPKEKIIEGLTNIGAPCEEEPEVKKLIVELTPNRPDWFAMEGLARSLRSYYFKEIREYKAKKGEYIVHVDKSVAKVRPYTVCAIVKGLTMTDERIADMVQVQEKLIATLGRWVKKFGMGLYPLERIKFPVRYTTMKPEEIRYLPLNYPNVADAREIIEKHEKGKAYGHIIKNFERWPVFVDADNKIMALIPIVNSADSGKVGLDTKEIFIEVSGIDGNVISAALNIIVTMFADMGGEIYTVDVKYPNNTVKTPDLKPKKMKLDIEKMNKLLGLTLKKHEVAVLASRMGYIMEGNSVLIPPFRADVIHEVDVFEDMAIAYGYNNFEPTMPDFFTPGKLLAKHNTLHDAMRNMGFLEMKTFVLTNELKADALGYGKGLKKITNPSCEEFTCLRPTLLVELLDVFRNNKTKGLPQRFYEIGLVYEEGKERNRLVFGIMDKKVEFSQARGFLQTLMKEQGKTFSLDKTASHVFDSLRAGDVFVDGQKKGVFGRLNQRILDQYGLEFDVYACELDVE